jgi:hypothetical protein
MRGRSSDYKFLVFCATYLIIKAHTLMKRGYTVSGLPDKVAEKVKRRRLLRLIREFPGLVK